MSVKVDLGRYMSSSAVAIGPREKMAQLAATDRDLRYTVLCGRSTITNVILACSLDVFQYRGMHALPLGKSFLILIAFRAG